MIKINLSNTQKQLDISNIGGLDLSLIKIKAVLIVVILIYLPDFSLFPMWDDSRTQEETAASAKQATLSSLKRKLAQSKDEEKQIQELKAQEENLGKKLIAVKEAISEKKNPSELLLFIVKNIPAELWITTMNINQKTILIKGEALDFKSITQFVNALGSSVFLTNPKISNFSNVTNSQRRVEAFEVSLDISRFSL